MMVHHSIESAMVFHLFVYSFIHNCKTAVLSFVYLVFLLFGLLGCLVLFLFPACAILLSVCSFD